MNSAASIAGLCFAVGLLGQPVWAQAVGSQNDGLQWLQRISTAAEKLNYSGTFVYRSGNRSETSRITHLSSNGQKLEKLEVLDGSPREVIRNNEEVRCYIPESRVVIIEQRTVRRTFPGLLPAGLSRLSDNYIIRKGAADRIAGHDSQIVRIETRDKLRYSHQLWVEANTGLLLKADILDENGLILESMAFTELHIGEMPTLDGLKSSYASSPSDQWRIRQANLREIRDDGPWLFRNELPGFRRQAAMRRTFGKDANDPGVLHWVYSDGLAALSVFATPLRSPLELGEESIESMGALNVVKRVVEGHQIIVMGDLPVLAVKRFADGIGIKTR